MNSDFVSVFGSLNLSEDVALHYCSLDVFEMELRHNDEQDYWRISCESMIGSATWILIPPVMSMITPKPHECMRFLELFELIGDALVNNKE